MKETDFSGFHWRSEKGGTMRIGKKIGVLVIGYFVIGGVIALTQLGMTKVFEPPCNGIALHTLWADFPRRLEGHEVLQGKREKSLIFGLGRGLAQWLPDLYQHLIAGDMTVRNYLLGGFVCYTGVPLLYGFSSESTRESGNKPDDAEITKHDVWTEEKGARKPQ
jgi:hypothetical protein